MNFSDSQSSTVQILTISRSDRWLVQQRLQSLSIPCHCPADGRLEVEVNTPVAIVQVRSVIQQLTAPRSELLDWLERCWSLAQ